MKTSARIHPLYDTEIIPGNQTVAKIGFFQRPLGQQMAHGKIIKDYEHTNVHQSSILDYPCKFYLKGISLKFLVPEGLEMKEINDKLASAKAIGNETDVAALLLERQALLMTRHDRETEDRNKILSGSFEFVKSGRRPSFYGQTAALSFTQNIFDDVRTPATLPPPSVVTETKPEDAPPGGPYPIAIGDRPNPITHLGGPDKFSQGVELLKQSAKDEIIAEAIKNGEVVSTKPLPGYETLMPGECFTCSLRWSKSICLSESRAVAFYLEGYMEGPA